MKNLIPDILMIIVLIVLFILLLSSCSILNRPIAKIYTEEEYYIAIDNKGNVIDINYCIDSLQLTGYKVIIK
jgi:type IV secretory pathway component VirB8